MKQKVYTILLLASLIFIYACRKANENYVDNDAEWLSGGKQTFFDQTTGGFSHVFEGLSERELFNHDIGDMAFEATFVTAPAPLNSGLGPIYNNVACSGCHINDGRGQPPISGQQLSSMLFRVSIPGTDPHGGPNPVPGFGGQFQPRTIAGKQAEGDVKIIYTDINGAYADGSPYILHLPQYTIVNTYMPMPGNTMLSPRIAPPVFGLGLLEAIEEADIRKHADENDANGDGISGKCNIVYDVMTQSYRLGRFGWKAGQPSLLQQSAGAYNEDMGITSFVFPNESCHNQSQYDGLDDETEVSDSILHAVAFYMQTLGVPARRNVNDELVLQGKKIFNQVQCAACHIPSFNTKVDMTFPSRSNQKIFPYTDMLLHDMGPELADIRPEFLADGREWRTQSLWGIGLTKKINGHEFFLHDGRARSLSEAILWHGGEAENSKQQYLKLSADERKALLKFLESL